MNSIYNDIHDPKRTRVAELENGFCPVCGRYLKIGYGHKPDCKHATQQDFDKAIDEARKQTQRAKRHAERLLIEVRTMHGKLALLKNENNKLRAANRNLSRQATHGSAS